MDLALNESSFSQFRSVLPEAFLIKASDNPETIHLVVLFEC